MLRTQDIMSRFMFLRPFRVALLVLLASFFLVNVLAKETCPHECLNGGVCDVNSAGGLYCRCLAPTALEPAFYRGLQCEMPATMCADTVDYYCAMYSTCDEIIQGEVYKCNNCTAPWGGMFCDEMGKECGSSGLRCYNGGSCRYSSCNCPSEWRGNANCTLPTPPGQTETEENFFGKPDPELGGVPYRLALMIGFGTLLVILLVACLIVAFLRSRKPKKYIQSLEQDNVIFLQTGEDAAGLEMGHYSDEPDAVRDDGRREEHVTVIEDDSEKLSLRPPGKASDE
eukprot:TRINITY_DN35496_c0_g1_i1.p1 TRINITY_DN35496_c0_g1~~TRINITY_DN35496_c0_g1_i1.p1  ORF type:complete len:284 (+),score=39.74 TRINITY_DN35496_c0_g1_i1:650-1501(+)